jgi:hypothetical protein
LTHPLAKAIAERIREVCPCTSHRFLKGDFDDLLGPEVTKEVLTGMPSSCELFAHAHEALSMAKAAKCAGYEGMVPASVDACLRWRRLAKWLRKLDRSVGT